MEDILKTLVEAHPKMDVAINQIQLVPALGWLVQYETWGRRQPCTLHVAHLRSAGSEYRVEWKHVLGAKNKVPNDATTR